MKTSKTKKPRMLVIYHFESGRGKSKVSTLEGLRRVLAVCSKHYWSTTLARLDEAIVAEIDFDEFSKDETVYLQKFADYFK